MRHNITSVLTQVCFYSGLVRGFQSVADRVCLHRNEQGTVAFPFLVRRRVPSFQILTYHRLSERPDSFFPGLPLNTFARQVNYLARHYQVLDLADILNRIRSGDELPPNSVALTFDDGYRDNFELAFPILRRCHIPATFFLTTGFVSRQDVLWNDKVAFALKFTRKNRLALSGTENNLRFEHWRTAAEGCFRLLWFLRRISHSEKLWRIEEILEQLDTRHFGFLWESMLTWDQARIMQAQGVHFGAHTVTHPILSRVPLDEARQEIVESKRTIERELAGSPRCLPILPETCPTSATVSERSWWKAGS